ncbi:MAG: hypothetical protein HYW48_04770 [Deltaproteobacteria bacterium]|nr:hypothetical protein [Deltaproteobacteria bacterium]
MTQLEIASLQDTKSPRSPPLSQRSIEQEFAQKTRDTYDAFAGKLRHDNSDRHPLVQYDIHWQFKTVAKKTTPKGDFVPI